MRKSCAAILLCLVASLGLASQTSARPRPRPRPPKILQSSFLGNHFAVRPGEMVFFSPVVQMITAIFTGPNVTAREFRHGKRGHIRWEEWNRTQAVAVAKWWEDDCSPSCARGKFIPTEVIVRAWRVRGGRYTRLNTTMLPTGLKPFTFADKLIPYHGVHYWGTRLVPFF